MNLTQIKTNKKYIITSVSGDNTLCRRLLDMGFAPGSEISDAASAPFGDTKLVYLRGRLIALRSGAASLVKVEPSRG